jgi:uncharacterized membrane protein
MTIFLTTAAAVGGALTAGVYVSFSAIVMPALGSLDAANAGTAMRRINVAAVRPPFMALFFGGAATAVAVAVAELASGPLDGRGAARVAGAALVLASHGVTVAANVPLNNALAALAPGSGQLARHWPVFASRWGRANTLRAVAAAVGSVVLAASLVGATAGTESAGPSGARTVTPR